MHVLSAMRMAISPITGHHHCLASYQVTRLVTVSQAVSQSPILTCTQKFSSIFYKIRNVLSFDILKMIYFTFVHSHLACRIEIYANTHLKYINKLVVLNSKILRILQNASRDTHAAELYAKFNTLLIPALHQCQILKLVRKFTHHHDKLQAIYSNYFTVPFL